MTDSSIFSKYTLVENVSGPIVFGTAIGIYDYLIEKKNINNCLYDGSIMAGSLFATKIADDILQKQLISAFGNENTQDLSNLLAQPLINTFLYRYLYNSIYVPKYGKYTRTDNMTMILGFATGFGQKMSNTYIINWLVNPLQSVF
jgi:hypothetical protein